MGGLRATLTWEVEPVSVSILSIEELDRLLKSWQGRTIRIRKVEQGNLDEVALDLDQVRYSETRTLDDYVGRYILELHGAGTVQPEEGSAPAALPGQAFEIPLTDDDRYILHRDHVELRTPRGSYHLWPETQPR